MPKALWPLITFIILFPVLFFFTLLYLNDLDAAKRALKLDFGSFSKIELWLSVGIAIFISTLLSYSVL